MCTKIEAPADQLQIRSIGIIRDPAVLSLSEWSMLVEQCNKEFGGMEISVVFFKNNLPVPKVEDRYRIIKEYHESSIGGHKGITKTYDKRMTAYDRARASPRHHGLEVYLLESRGTRKKTRRMK